MILLICSQVRRGPKVARGIQGEGSVAKGTVLVSGSCPGEDKGAGEGQIVSPWSSRGMRRGRACVKVLSSGIQYCSLSIMLTYPS